MPPAIRDGPPPASIGARGLRQTIEPRQGQGTGQQRKRGHDEPEAKRLAAAPELGQRQDQNGKQEEPALEEEQQWSDDRR